MKFLNLNNPLAVRLGRRAGCFSSQVALGLSTTLGLLISFHAVEREILHGSVSHFIYPLAGGSLVILASLMPMLALALIASALVFIPYAASSVTLTYFQSQEYPFLRATSLSDLEVVTGFVLATLYRCRALLGLSLGLLPAIVTIVYPGHFRELYVIDAPVSESALLRDILQAFLKHSLLTLAFGISFGGFILLAVTLGVGSALWWRHTAPAAAIALLLPVGFYLIVTWLRTIIDEKLGQSFLGDIVQAIFLLPFPYLFAYGSLYLAGRWTRR